MLQQRALTDRDRPCSAIYAEYHGQHPGDGTAFGIVNGGGCRTSLPLGNVTHLAMPGQAVWDTFNKVLHGLEGRDRRNGTLFHTSSNVRVEWNYQAADKAQRLVSVTVNGRALDRAATYRLVTTDFLAYGGDGYWLNSGFKPVDTPRTVEETLRDYLASNPQVSYRNMDRMIEVSGLRQPPRRDPSQRLWTPRRDPSDCRLFLSHSRLWCWSRPQKPSTDSNPLQGTRTSLRRSDTGIGGKGGLSAVYESLVGGIGKNT